jgi:CBS domain-containing protein
VKTVGDLLKTKGSDVWSVSAEATVYETLGLMAEKRVGALLVLQAGRLIGIVSERDYARKVELKGKSSRDTTVSEIMTVKVAYVKPQNTVAECMALMTDKRIRHLPVMDGDQLVGVISIGDVVKAVIAEQEFTIHQLENYITGQ